MKHMAAGKLDPKGEHTFSTRQSRGVTGQFASLAGRDGDSTSSIVPGSSVLVGLSLLFLGILRNQVDNGQRLCSAVPLNPTLPSPMLHPRLSSPLLQNCSCLVAISQRQQVAFSVLYGLALDFSNKRHVPQSQASPTLPHLRQPGSQTLRSAFLC